MAVMSCFPRSCLRQQLRLLYSPKGVAVPEAQVLSEDAAALVAKAKADMAGEKKCG